MGRREGFLIAAKVGHIGPCSRHYFFYPQVRFPPHSSMAQEDEPLRPHHYASSAYPTTPRLKLKVHRSRFVDWAPSAITAIALPPAPPPAPSNKAQSLSLKWFGTLAIGRANGNIELYEWSEDPEEKSFAPQAWVLRKVKYVRNVCTHIYELTIRTLFLPLLLSWDVYMIRRSSRAL